MSLRSDAATRPLPLPEGYDWSDVSYVVGGQRRKSIYVNNNGYCITDSGGLPERNQYNLDTGEWSDFHPGEVNKPVDCGPCHTTGYSSIGHQGGLPGIQGTWALEGVQCEACHGPGSLHVVPPYSNISVNPASALCGQCHSNGPTSVVPAAAGFIQPNAQYNELLASPHEDRQCIECHDPHKKAALSLKMHCTQCHYHVRMADKDDFQSLGKRHVERGVECWDCHMPYAVKSAVATSFWQADTRSHLFKITLAEEEMFQQSGTQAAGKITAAYACLGCHVDVATKWMAKGRPEKAEAWARKYGGKIHKRWGGG